MSSQDIIQAYLQRHKIGLLFEDLMSKLINDQPNEPLTYLTGVLQIKAERKGEKSHLRKSTGDLDTIAVAKDRGYERPWQTNSKRLKPKEAEAARQTRKSMPSKPEWNARTRSPTALDDFWDQGDTGKGTVSRGGRQSTSPTRRPPATAGNQWADAGDEDLLFRSYGYRGPNKGSKETGDPLAGEFSLAKGQKPASKSTAGKGTCSSTKAKGRKQDTLKHRRALEQKILEGQKGRDSGFEEDDRHAEADSAIELMEDLEELRREGVTNAKNASGIRISKSQRSGSRSAQPQVKVGICARCAQVMGGGMPSEPAVNSSSFGQLPDFEADTPREYPTSSRPQSSRYTAGSPGPFGSDEEDFESVSQVTGPRRPVWQDADNDALTPRKGTHMFSSNMSPAKGYPMYSTDRPATASEGRRTSPQKDPRSAALRQTWGPGVSTSADFSDTAASATKTEAEQPQTEQQKEQETETTKDEEVERAMRTTPSAGPAWAPPDDDTDASSIYGAPVKGQKARGTYQGAF